MNADALAFGVCLLVTYGYTVSFRLWITFLSSNPCPGQEGRTILEKQQQHTLVFFAAMWESRKAIQIPPEGAQMPQMKVPKPQKGFAGRVKLAFV